MYVAVAGVSKPDPYDLWVSDETLNEYEPRAQEFGSDFRGHYKSKLVEMWDKLGIKQVILMTLYCFSPEDISSIIFMQITLLESTLQI